MAGGIIIVIVVALLLPVGAIMSGAVVAAILGWSLTTEAEASHQGSELIELNS